MLMAAASMLLVAALLTGLGGPGGSIVAACLWLAARYRQGHPVLTPAEGEPAERFAFAEAPPSQGQARKLGVTADRIQSRIAPQGGIVQAAPQSSVAKR